MAIDNAPTPVAGQQRFPQFTGQPRFFHIERPAGRSAPIVGQGCDNLVAKVEEQRRVAHLGSMRDVAQPDVPSSAVICVIPSKQVKSGADRDIINVPLSARDHLQPCAIGPHPHNPSPSIGQLSPIGPGRLDEPVVPHGDIDPPVNSPLNAIRRVVGTSKAEIKSEVPDQHLRVIGHPVPCPIAIDRQVGRMQHIQLGPPAPSTGHREKSARTVDRCEIDKLVGDAIAVGIPASHHPTPPRLFVERPVQVNPHIHRPVEVAGQADWIADLRRGGEQRHAKSSRGLQPPWQTRPLHVPWLKKVASRDYPLFKLGAMHFKLEETTPAAGNQTGDRQPDVPNALR